MTNQVTRWMEKTYSGEQSFHEKLITAQAFSPPHLWALCHILCSLEMDPSKFIQESNWIDMSSRWPDEQQLHYYFSDSISQCNMCQMIDHSFGTQVIWLQQNDSTERPMVRIRTWTQFCAWIQSGVVTIDNKKNLSPFIHSKRGSIMEREVLTADMSFREMLVRAQQTSPVLTYVVCSLLMEIKLPEELNKMHRLETRQVFSDDPFVFYFNHSAELRPFLLLVFQNFTVRMNYLCCGFDDRFYHTLDAHPPFVYWVQHNVKSINHERLEVIVPQ